MAYASADEFDVTDDEDDTIPYLKQNDSRLQDILLRDVPDDVLTMISDLVNFTSESEYDSLHFVSDLLADRNVSAKKLNLRLAHIKGRANDSHMNPLLFALRSPLKHERSLSDLIKVLHKRGRLDVLKELRSYIEDILKKRNNEQRISSALQSINSMAQLELRIASREGSTNGYSLEDQNSLDREQLVLELPFFKPELDEHSLTVFVPHAKKDENVAREFQSLLIHANIIVKLLADIDYHITGDSEVLHAILKYVDFVVPVISNEYLSLIYPRIQAGDVTDYAANNRFIYKWMFSEYRLNNSFNFRVRPVSVPEMNVQHVRNLRNPIFSYPFQLFDDVPKLIEMLNKSRLRNLPCIKRYDESSDDNT